jgi:16S rRNA (adenine1518-N6/adenine1519-N6)-dimethyltransferase
MGIFKPSTLLQYLEELGIRPRKAWSQNFLIDGNIIRKIVKTAEVQEGDLVLEIGPGPGALTEALLEAQAHVIAVEKDPILAKGLLRLQTPNNTLTVIEGDILDLDIQSTIAQRLQSSQKAKVIANLPYHITTPILARLIPERDLFSKLVLMVQDEVARRFTAKPHTSAYSSFTVFLEYYAYVQYAFGVSQNCFYPKPSVQSAVVSLTLHEPPPITDEEGFFKMTRRSFEHRRKMLRASLPPLYLSENVTNALITLGLNEKARPEDLSLEEFVKLFVQLSKQ